MTTVLDAKAIVDALLLLNPDGRVHFLNQLKYNDIFCDKCGYGSKESPNPDCQCWNDE